MRWANPAGPGRHRRGRRTHESIVTIENCQTRRGSNPHLDIGATMADAGYDSDANLTAPGPDRIIALGKRNNIAGDDRPTSDPGQHATARQKMAWRPSTPEGEALDKKRGATVEPVNGHLKDQRGLRRFSRRGTPAAKAELALAALTTNPMRWYTTTEPPRRSRQPPKFGTASGRRWRSPASRFHRIKPTARKF